MSAVALPLTQQALAPHTRMAAQRPYASAIQHVCQPQSTPQPTTTHHHITKCGCCCNHPKKVLSLSMCLTSMFGKSAIGHVYLAHHRTTTLKTVSHMYMQMQHPPS